MLSSSVPSPSRSRFLITLFSPLSLFFRFSANNTETNTKNLRNQKIKKKNAITTESISHFTSSCFPVLNKIQPPPAEPTSCLSGFFSAWFFFLRMMTLFSSSYLSEVFCTIFEAFLDASCSAKSQISGFFSIFAKISCNADFSN